MHSLSALSGIMATGLMQVLNSGDTHAHTHPHPHPRNKERCQWLNQISPGFAFAHLLLTEANHTYILWFLILPGRTSHRPLAENRRSAKLSLCPSSTSDSFAVSDCVPQTFGVQVIRQLSQHQLAPWAPELQYLFPSLFWHSLKVNKSIDQGDTVQKSEML